MSNEWALPGLADIQPAAVHWRHRVINVRPSWPALPAEANDRRKCMQGQIVAPGGRSAIVQPVSFERVGGVCAVLAGLGGLVYAISFVVIARSNPALGGLLSALFLALNGLLTTAARAALYGRVRQAGETAALWAFLVGSAGALGAAVHGGYDLANALHPPAALSTDLPNQVDPRGLLTFGVAGLALFVFAWLLGRQAELPRGLAYLGWLLAALLVVIYLGRLIILDPTNLLLLGPVLLAGFIVNPAWYIWLGLALLRRPREG
jgi:hypothetical protein